METNLLDFGGVIHYNSDFLSDLEATKLFKALKTNVNWEHKQVAVYGKQYKQPRLTAWFADSPEMTYSYSGLTQIVQPWMPELLDLKDQIEEISGVDYNSVLLNYYRNGFDGVGLHSDNEKELGVEPNIASISLGAIRTFRLIKNGTTKPEIDYPLAHGSLLIMSGTIQQYYKHMIVRDPTITDGRINLTFRKIYK